MITPEDPRWPKAIVLLDAMREQLNLLEAVIGDDPEPNDLLTLIEQRSAVATAATLVFAPEES